MSDDIPATFRDQPVHRFADRDRWEAWLAANGQLAGGFWMAFAKKGSGAVSVSKPDAIEVALCHGWIDGQTQPLDAAHWLVRFTPRRARSIWSQVNRVIAERLIDEGRMRPAGLAEVERARADGRWDAAYPPASRVTVPDDLQTALDREPVAAAAFPTLKGAARYAVLHRIGQARSPETRARRIEACVAMLASGETPR